VRVLRAGRAAALCGAIALCPAPALAWPEATAAAIARDARRLLPEVLAKLLEERDAEIRDALRTKPPDIEGTLWRELTRARLSAAGQKAVSADLARLVDALRGPKLSEALVAMGARHRAVASLGDPALALDVARTPLAPRLRDEFYAFVALHRDKFPIVIADPEMLEAGVDTIPRWLDRLRSPTRSHAAVLAEELTLPGRRVTRATDVDLRSPVFAAASASYSRSVVAVAGTWLAVWRAAGGDLSGRPRPRRVGPGS
jgi:hypothetical protein